jgi:hypothetical protein
MSPCRGNTPLLNGGLKSILYALLDEAITLTGADMGHCHVVDPMTGTLRIVASHGFDAPCLELFKAVDDNDSVDPWAAAAVKQAQRIVVSDIEKSPLFAGTRSGKVLRAAGVRAVQSTPVFYRAGHIAGLISTHWYSVATPSEDRLRQLDAAIFRIRHAIAAERQAMSIAAIARDMISRHGSEAALIANRYSRINFDKGAMAVWAEIGQAIRAIQGHAPAESPGQSVGNEAPARATNLPLRSGKETINYRRASKRPGLSLRDDPSQEGAFSRRLRNGKPSSA